MNLDAIRNRPAGMSVEAAEDALYDHHVRQTREEVNNFLRVYDLNDKFDYHDLVDVDDPKTSEKVGRELQLAFIDFLGGEE